MPASTEKLLLADRGYIETERLLAEITAEIESVYGQAEAELTVKAQNYLREFNNENIKKRAQVVNGELDIDDYKSWLNTQILGGQRIYAMVDVMSTNLTNSNLIAESVINGYMPQVYATNMNYTTYTIENTLRINTIFTLYDEQTIERLVRDKPDLLPHHELNIPKDQLWNKSKLTGAVTQGILQGETVDEIARRLRQVTDMNKSASLRNAATMTTSAQNGGRMAGYERAQNMGIKLKHRWLATLDGHTRLTHRQCDGTVVEVGEEFPNGLLFPGDPDGPPGEVYNCRCTTIAVFDDSSFDIKLRNNRIERMGNMSYSEWKNAHGGEPLFKAARNVNRDMRMHEEYMSLLGKKIPKNFTEFQKLKYNNRALWWKLVGEARKARNRRRAKI